MVTRFELEEAITACSQISSDLALVAECVLHEELAPDDIANILTGLQVLHDLKCAKAESIMAQLIKNGTLV